MKIHKNDFVEIEFTGKIKNTGEIFDTNIQKEAEKINLKINSSPLIVSVGNGMVVNGFDRALENKEIMKEYKQEIKPEEAFGLRNPKLVKIIPPRVFREQNLNPAPGMIINLDNMLARVISISGGRIILDFNNPLAGKEVEYIFTIKRKVSDEKEKISALQDFFFRQRFSFSEENNKILFEKKAEPFVKIFGSRFKEILGKEAEITQEKVSSIKHTKQK